jgi:hypothetical protein
MPRSEHARTGAGIFLARASHRVRLPPRFLRSERSDLTFLQIGVHLSTMGITDHQQAVLDFSREFSWLSGCHAVASGDPRSLQIWEFARRT